MTVPSPTCRHRPPAPRRRRRVLAALAAIGAGAVLALLPASAAWAHGAHSPTATNFQAEITGIAPQVDGIEVRVIEAGTGLEVSNHTGVPVEVLGYDGEPYLRITPDAVYENTHSPATYLNEDYTGAAPVPPHADPQAAPSWRRVEDEPFARWYDHRTHWMSPQQPPQVAAQPDTRHRVLDWSVPLRHGDTDIEVTGTLDWVPPPPGWPWWTGAALAAGAVAATGLLAHTRWARAALAALVAAGGATALAYAVGRELDAGATSAGQVLVWLATGLLWPALSGLAALAAAGYLLVTIRSRQPSEAAAVAVAVAGACVAIFAGFADAAVFTRSVPPVPWDLTWARVSVLLALATGVGAAAAGALTLRRQRMRADADGTV